MNLVAIDDAVGWQEYPPGTVYRCRVALTTEADGRVSAVAAGLPGVASQGRGEAEALANVREALAGAILAYRDAGVPVPWEASRGAGRAAAIRTVFVRVDT